MSLLPFEGSRLKVRRARKHIAELRETVLLFGEAVKVDLVVASETETHKHWIPQFSIEPPEDGPVIIGDAIHNLRSSLDILVCDLARLRGRSIDKMKFPFAESEEKLDETLQKHFPRLGADIVEALRACKPFKGGNIGLRGLHDLDVMDKHRAILPTYTAVRMTPQFGEPIMGLMAATGFDFSEFDVPVTAEQGILLQHNADPWRLAQLSPEGPEPSFPKGSPFSGEAVLDVLESLAQLCDQIIEAFAAKFGGGDSEAASAPIRFDPLLNHVGPVQSGILFRKRRKPEV